MHPDYIELLADKADPHNLWRRLLLDRETLSDEQLVQLDTGVALRRHASDVRALMNASSEGKSLLITRLSGSSRAISLIPIEPGHRELMKTQAKALQKPRIKCLPGYYDPEHGFVWGLFRKPTSRKACAFSRDLRRLAKSRFK